MKLNLLDDTIVAVSTPLGEAGIGIVRLSGKESLSIADRIFVSKDKSTPSKYKTYTVHYGHIVDRSKITDHEIIDEVILTVMRKPRTYTKEDIVEINCHSGIIPLRKILELCLKCGARLAEPGEFTKRAFLNGRIDLVQAEAVLDIIKSRTDQSLKAAASQLEGHLSAEIGRIKDSMIDALVDVEASIDFPEEDINTRSKDELLQKINQISSSLRMLIESAQEGSILREGISCVICGKPNVGKSSLLNSLAKKDRAIVTAIPGTTRDFIEEPMNIKGIPLRLFDTAGITESQNIIEKEGIRRTRKLIQEADLIILVLDGSAALSSQDSELIEQVKAFKSICAVNKIDLPQRIEQDKIREAFPDRTVSISATERIGLDNLSEVMAKMVYNGRLSSAGDILVTNLRHKDALERAYNSVAEAKKSLENLSAEELLALDLKDALDALGDITGETAAEDILNKIFDTFCIGK